MSPTHRFLLMVDGHSSRLHADCLAKAKEIGFDMIIFPGGMTAVLQIMDQVFGAIKKDFTQRAQMARVFSSGRSLDLQGRIRIWCEAKRAFEETGGPSKIKSAAVKLGLFPVSLAASLENLAARTRAPKTAAAVAGGDLSILADKTVRTAGLKRRRVSDLTDAVEAMLDDSPSDGEEAEGAAGGASQPAKSRRVNYPVTCWTGSEFAAAQAYKTAGLEATAAAKAQAAAVRAANAATNRRLKAEAAARTAEKRMWREQAAAAAAEAATAKTQPAPPPTAPRARSAARGAG